MLKKIEVPITGTIVARISDHQNETDAARATVLAVELFVNSHMTGPRLHLNVVEPAPAVEHCLLLIIRNGVEPELLGPYPNAEHRDAAAKLRTHPADSVFAFDIDEHGKPSIAEYGGDFFDDLVTANALTNLGG